YFKILGILTLPDDYFTFKTKNAMLYNKIRQADFKQILLMFDSPYSSVRTGANRVALFLFGMKETGIEQKQYKDIDRMKQYWRSKMQM
ncbi:MAG: hypothetical protein V3V22_10750, partial [Methylococcales bacterium]